MAYKKDQPEGNREELNTLTSRARSLRKQATDAERLLWRYLRGRHMDGYKFRRQVVIKPYIVDFICLEALLIIEADGGQHLEQVVYDDKRSIHLKSAGYRVMRFWNHDILTETEAVLEQIHNALMESSQPK